MLGTPATGGSAGGNVGAPPSCGSAGPSVVGGNCSLGPFSVVPGSAGDDTSGVTGGVIVRSASSSCGAGVWDSKFGGTAGAAAFLPPPNSLAKKPGFFGCSGAGAGVWPGTGACSGAGVAALGSTGGISYPLCYIFSLNTSGLLRECQLKHQCFAFGLRDVSEPAAGCRNSPGSVERGLNSSFSDWGDTSAVGDGGSSGAGRFGNRFAIAPQKPFFGGPDPGICGALVSIKSLPTTSTVADFPHRCQSSHSSRLPG